MLSQEQRDASTVWLHEPALGGWSDDIGQLPSIGVVNKRFATDGGLLDKVDDDKLARDVEDLSAIFEELEGGVVDFPLPCDDEEVATGAEVTGDWIGDLENDVVNVDELSSMFDALAAEQATVMETAVETSDDDDEEEAMYDSDESYDDDVEGDDHAGARAINVQIIPAPPTWATSAPLDPRSVIRTPVFKNLDSRIPRVEIPRMDFACGPAGFTFKPATAVPGLRPVSTVSPKPCSKKTATAAAKEPQYLHDPSSCWICKSDKSPYKKYALHRYLEKRHRRNWKRGPRYSGRSNVATNRVREGGRFITTAHWV